ncbi:MAG: RluA family pseudouridine synthase [Paludibacteraceae bacterium]|nr:RluA family pseudouridine synthase [Paludibacteraceae bacterium]
MISPYVLPPHPLAVKAAGEVTERVHAYMRQHPDSELHRQGKMFGVLVVQDQPYLAAFSAQLDGTYEHEGFVPPVYAMTPPVGKDKHESQRLQRLIFASFNLLNGKGESKNLLEIFAETPPIIPPEEWFAGRGTAKSLMPPAGAGECCAPKLLNYAYKHGLKPLALAEFWVGAPSKTDVREEGCFYPPCSGRCVPILNFMLQGTDVAQTPEFHRNSELCQQTKILFEDDYLLVVNKPSGLLSVPGKSGEKSVVEHLSEQRDGMPLWAAHRLDQDTSGLLVIAKTPEVYKNLQAYFQRRDILKRYEAVIVPREQAAALAPEGLISLPLLPNPYDRPRQMVNTEHGKPALTRYVLRKPLANGAWFVDFYPLTGRTHQLRVHAAHPLGLNAPIAGDRLYGTGTEQAERLLLHAAEIRFVHPITGEDMHFCVPSGFAENQTKQLT